MSKNKDYKFDSTEPTPEEIASPAVDHFTDLMEQGTDALVEEAAVQEAVQDAIEAQIRRPRPDVIQAVFGELRQALVASVKKGRVLVRETQLAFAFSFLNIAETELSACDFEVFHQTQQEILNIISMMHDDVISRVPTAEQLARADVATETKQ